MRKTFLMLTVFFIITVLMSGCTGKITTELQDTQPSTPSVPAVDVAGTDDIPEVLDSEGIVIEELVQDAETEVDLGSLIIPAELLEKNLVNGFGILKVYLILIV